MKWLSDLKQRKLVQWVVAYAAGAWVLLQVLSLLSTTYTWHPVVMRVIPVVLAVGIVIVGVLAWFHGERGRQSVSAVEVAILVAVVVLGSWVAYGQFTRNAGNSSIQVDPRLEPSRVLVLPLRNETASAELEHVGRMAADWITQGLARAEFIEVVDAGTALELDEQSRGAPPAAASLARAMGAGLVVSGAFYRSGDSVHFQTRITDAKTNRVVIQLDPVSGSASDPRNAVDVLRRQVLGRLASRLDPRLGYLSAEASQPPTYEAYQAWFAGLEHFSRRQWMASIGQFVRAAELDSTFVSPLIWAAGAYGNNRMQPQKDSILHQLSRVRDRLVPFDRLHLDFHLADNDNNARFGIAGRMVELSPNSLLARFYLGLVGRMTNRSSAVISALGSGTATTSDLWYAWTTPLLLDAYHMRGDYDAELRTATAVLQVHPTYEDAVGYRLRAAIAAGRSDEVDGMLRSPPTVPTSAAQRWNRAYTASLEARAHSKAVFLSAIDSAVAQTLERGTTESKSQYDFRVLRTHALAGRWCEAQSIADQLIEDSPASLAFNGTRAVTAARCGDARLAREISAQLDSLASLSRADGRCLDCASVRYWQARIAAQLGEHDRALSLLRDALAQGLPYSIDLHRQPDFHGLFNNREFQRLLEPRD